MQVISKETIQSWERFYRGNFVNSLSGFKSASLIATINKEGIPNLAIFSNIVHLGADPALIGFINRPLEAAPHTLANIEATGFYTINHIHPDFVAQAHQTSAKYALSVNEFVSVGLHEEYLNDFPVPFVKESRCSYAMKMVEIIPIKHNSTFFVIGELQQVRIEEGIYATDGFIKLEEIESITSLGIDGYYSVTPMGRYNYAKPGVAPVRLKE
ncbi:flavin oxidoreductase [Chryseotalea sanaruensis]|uniref:Flavin oxidoreductase n=1 Tax=Chryseotalea sanaruensis TaxID=2482724 RepID=A0A401U617_9BACT|nr:flavin reductase [Chryseotalea sanaruensis]GCC50236.1 flavin oxidoreductase [Chryseotalea sanaruensis]